MPTETSYKDFKFRSSLGATNFVTRGFGLAIIWVSIDFLDGWWLHPSLEKLPRMLSGLPFGLPLLAVGAMFVLNACQIEILDGQLRFRRFFTWQSVPLESVTSVRRLWVPGTYIKINHAGKCHRLIFNAQGDKVYSGRSPVIGFLQEVCRRNAANRASLP